MQLVWSLLLTHRLRLTSHVLTRLYGGSSGKLGVFFKMCLILANSMVAMNVLAAITRTSGRLVRPQRGLWSLARFCLAETFPHLFGKNHVVSSVK